ncbi:MAG: hypothetical protein P4M07_27920 [Xanthobacteraceae bacterium]|nr:hypothetical protein [Xanthobacteraceae bacterium]
MKRNTALRPCLALLALSPFLVNCGSSLSDYSLKDQEWFARPSRMFNRAVSLETPPLNPTAPVAPSDLVDANGACAGTASTDANALADGQPAPVTGTVALGHTECDVARAAGNPDNVNISANERGDRLAVLTYNHGPRPGIYRFTAGRLTDVEGVAVPEAPPTARKSRKKPAAATSSDG